MVTRIADIRDGVVTNITLGDDSTCDGIAKVALLERLCSVGWVLLDGVFSLPPLVPIVPQVVSMRQARVALRRAGLLDSVTAMVDAIGGEAVDTWEYSQEVQRSNPLVGVVASQAGWTTAQLDQLFIDASTM